MSKRSLVCTLMALIASVSQTVELRGALPLAIETQKFKPADNEHYDLFGASLAVSGQTAMITAFRGGIGSSNAGSTYVYDRSPAGLWTLSSELTINDPTFGNGFGAAVDMDGQLAVISALTVGPGGSQAGAAFVFERGVSGAWQQVAKLLPDNPASHNYFGVDVAISGDTIVVGDFQDDSAAVNAGAAYVFERGGNGAWAQTAKLAALNAAAGAEFGVSVDIDDARIVVGAPDHGFAGNNPGAAYVFEKQAANWLQTANFSPTASNATSQFGLSVAINGNTVAVGDPRTPDGNNVSGSVQLFDRSPSGAWGFSQQINTDYNRNGYGDFGRSVALTSTRLLIGAEDHNLANDWNGAAYAYTRAGSGEWDLDATMVGTGSIDGRFGSAVAVDGDSAFVGAWRVNFEAGLAYYYKLTAPIPEPATNLLSIALLATCTSRRRRRAGSR